jgi:2-hydroxychromene-2-carboxylate isomerase
VLGGKRDTQKMAQITFWFEFASTYSYLSAMRIDEMAKEADIDVVWKPFLLGPIFKSQNWETSPFYLYPAKGAYMVRDITRIAKDRGLAFHLPDPFPQNSLHAARLALVGLTQGWGRDFIKSIYEMQFAEGRNISDRATLALGLEVAGAPPEGVFEKANTSEIKAKLRANTEEAQALGLFGAPSFTTAGGELFWGDDRLEQAFKWSRR